MIVKQNRSWLKMIFTVRGSALKETWRRITVITILSVMVTVVEKVEGWDVYTLTLTPFTLIGVALGIFLGFRTNAAYDRYWEGRKLWGAMVNESRSFARQVLTLIAVPEEWQADASTVRGFQEDLVRRMIAYVHALRHLLRDSDPFDDIQRVLTAEDADALRGQKNVPIAMLQDIELRLQRAWRDGWISAYHLPVLVRRLSNTTDIQGGCERIKNTPIPFTYSVLIHRIVAFYCFFLPFGIVESIGGLTPIVVFMISYAFFGLDEIGDEIEDPFSTEPQDLPLTALCRTIEVNLLQAIGQSDVPPFMKPVDDVLV
jgi:ion channel-forming bestrophin family protein